MASALVADERGCAGAGFYPDKAAEELASYESRLSGIEARLAVLTWMVGFNLVMTAGTLWRVFTH